MPKFKVPDLDKSAIQKLLDADPLYQQHLKAFQAADKNAKPLASNALAADFNRLVPYEQRGNSRYAAGIGGDGKVKIQDRNNPWTDPGFIGPLAVTAATLGLGTPLLGLNGASAAPIIGTGVAPAVAPAIPTTMGIADATVLGLPATAGLGTAGTLGGAAAGAVLPAAAPAAAPALPVAPAATPPPVTPPPVSHPSLLSDSIKYGNLIGVGGSLLGGYLSNRANSKAAQEQNDAYLKAAELQDAAAKRTEEFLRQQAENQFLNSEVTRRGNYDQWRAREQRFSNLSQELGAGARDIPDYAPGVDPRYTNTSTTQSTNTSTPGGGTTQPRTTLDGQTNTSTTQTSNDPIQQALIDNYKTLGVSPTGPGSGPTDIAYFAQRIQETGGLTEDNKNYWFGPNGRIAQELAKGKSGGGTSSTQTLSNTSSGYKPFQYSPLVTQPLTPSLTDAPQSHLPMPGTLAALAQQQKWFY